VFVLIIFTENNQIYLLIIFADHLIIFDRCTCILEKFNKKIISIQRPIELSMDDSGTEGAIGHAVDYLSKFGINIDYIVLLQPTSPFRKVEFIDESILLIKSSNRGSLISVSDPIQHPSDFLFDDGKEIKYVCRDVDSYRRQDFKASKFINGSIYITKNEYFQRTGKIYSLDDCVLYEMPIEYSIDIDTPFDLAVCEAVMKNTKGR
jgi:CMP-N-acetylneuraminic acid synthetase